MSTAPSILHLHPAELRERLDSGEPLRLIDVRTPWEHSVARLEPSELLTEELALELLDSPPSPLLVLYCHHGVRSFHAAQWFVERGVSQVANLVGGIEAWSLEVDPTVPRY
jgi:rhodanese-related sulfurtransferase